MVKLSYEILLSRIVVQEVAYVFDRILPEKQRTLNVSKTPLNFIQALYLSAKFVYTLK